MKIKSWGNRTRTFRREEKNLKFCRLYFPLLNRIINLIPFRNQYIASLAEEYFRFRKIYPKIFEMRFTASTQLSRLPKAVILT